MKVIAVIPARMASTRFPGKPLADILGLPMIEHVRRRTLLCRAFSEVVVATCDDEIFEIVENSGGKAITGISMLIHQAIEGLELITGENCPYEIMEKSIISEL